MNIVFHEESFILAEKTQSAGIANSLTGQTLPAIAPKLRRRKLSEKFMIFYNLIDIIYIFVKQNHLNYGTITDKNFD
ncbi:hypothetical protein FNO01nite_34130 [Flavobacterium noncentrifugens]|nr:hypothetical protein FNO01nite_34130 [Flavobacterium noncentrifugens]